MALLPEFNDFAAGFAAGANQVVYTRLAADLDTPVSLMLKLNGADSRINRTARFDDQAFTPCDGDPLTALRGIIAESKIDLPGDGRDPRA